MNTLDQHPYKSFTSKMSYGNSQNRFCRVRALFRKEGSYLHFADIYSSQLNHQSLYWTYEVTVLPYVSDCRKVWWIHGKLSLQLCVYHCTKTYIPTTWESIGYVLETIKSSLISWVHYVSNTYPIDSQGVGMYALSSVSPWLSIIVIVAFVIAIIINITVVVIVAAEIIIIIIVTIKSQNLKIGLLPVWICLILSHMLTCVSTEHKVMKNVMTEQFY